MYYCRIYLTEVRHSRHAWIKHSGNVVHIISELVANTLYQQIAAINVTVNNCDSRKEGLGLLDSEGKRTGLEAIARPTDWQLARMAGRREGSLDVRKKLKSGVSPDAHLYRSGSMHTMCHGADIPEWKQARYIDINYDPRCSDGELAEALDNVLPKGHQAFSSRS